MDYRNGKIYVLRNRINDAVYIGSTTQSLAKRMSKHKQDLNAKQTQKRLLFQKFNELGFDNFYIELIELFPCSSKEELTAREGHWIRHFDSFNNGYNSVVIGRTSQDYKQEYKEQIAEKNKQYRQENIEKATEYSRNYRHANKEIIAERQKQKWQITSVCECGCEIKKCRAARHARSAKHKKLMEKLSLAKSNESMDRSRQEDNESKPWQEA